MTTPEKQIANPAVQVGPPSKMVQGTVHRIGDAEISESQQGDITVFSVRGSYSVALLDLMQRILCRAEGSAGLDLREFKGPGRSVLPYLRKINRHFLLDQRIFLLYEPPSRVQDQLKLSNSLEEFSLYTEVGGLVSRAEPALRSDASETQVHPGADPTPSIVRFTRDLDRAVELESSLDTASQRSLKMLSLQPPEFEPFELATAYYPHDKVGGDFLHVVDLEDNLLGLTIGDVSGHGIEAALIMGMTRKVFDIRAREGEVRDPASVTRQVNRDIYPDLDRYTFVTAFYGILDRVTGSFRFARAGHNYPLLVSPARGEVLQLDTPGIALGMDAGDMFDQVLEVGEETLQPGDLLMIYTDGLIESAHPRRGQFGFERLVQFFREVDMTLPVEEIKSRLLNTLHRFLDGELLQDDLTLLLAKYKG